MGGAQGTVRQARGEAARGPRRGPSARVRRLRGRDPRGQLRRGALARLGPGHLSPRGRRRPARGGAPRQARPRVRRLQDARPVGAGAHESRRARLALHQEGGRGGRGPGADRAISRVGALRPHHRGNARGPVAPRAGPRPPPRRRRPARRRPGARRALHAGDARGRAPRRRRLGVRGEVRRRPRARGAARPRRRALRAQRPGDDQPLSRGRPRTRRVAPRRLRDRRRDHRDRPGRSAELPAPPVAHGPRGRSGHRARGDPGARGGDLLRLPHARRLRLAAARAPRSQGVPQAPAAARGPRV